tara:strand:- start:504 stop:1253 length:750 start_codon:yes stop_codon:yes gene_type:complete
MPIELKKAEKRGQLLRAAVFGPSGSGKTFSSLSIAQGMDSGEIGVIDTERGSASKYADRFDFWTVQMTDYSIDEYCAALEACGKVCGVVIIDSLTHAWQSLLAEVDKLAQAKYRGNTWSAWSEGTPKQKQLVEALLQCPAHIIATMRTKTEWQTTDDGRGKMRPVRVGLAPEQGKGIEYEFDVLFELTTDHIANVIKDRTGRFQDRLIEKPGEDFGKELAGWLRGDGTAPVMPETVKETAVETKAAKAY